MSVPFQIRDDDGNTTIERRYHGRVLREWEKNGYHDSDWYVHVMEDDGTFSTICYSTTRGGSAPANADVDATSEVLAAWKVELGRLARVRTICNLRNIIKEAGRFNLTPRQWVDVRHAVGGRDWDSALVRHPRFDTPGVGLLPYARVEVHFMMEALRKLAAGSFRSDFKRKLAQQVYDWATTAPERRPYPTPLSKRQMAYVG